MVGLRTKACPLCHYPAVWQPVAGKSGKPLQPRFSCNTPNCPSFTGLAAEAAWDAWEAQVRGAGIRPRKKSRPPPPLKPYRSKKMTYFPPDEGVTFDNDETPHTINMILDPTTRQPMECPQCERVLVEYCFAEYRVALGCSGGCVVTSIGPSKEAFAALRAWILPRLAAAPVHTADEMKAEQERLATRLERAALRLVKDDGGES